MDILEKLNQGGIENELPSKFSIATIKGRLDLDKAVIAGHSFGGATTISTLSQDKRFK